MGVFSTMGGYDACGGYLEYYGGYSVQWGDIMINVGISWVPWGISWVPWWVILSTVGDTQCHGDIMMHVGGYHEYRGEKNFCYLSTLMVLMIPPHMYHDIPHSTQITKDGIPPWYWTPPRYSWYLRLHHDIPHGTQDNPHGTHDIHPRYWAPPHDIPPHLSWYSPTVQNIPHSTQDIPHMHHDIPPWYWTPPVYWAPPWYWTHIIQGDKGKEGGVLKLINIHWYHVNQVTLVSVAYDIQTQPFIY